MIVLLAFASLVIAWALLEALLTPTDRPAAGTLALPTGFLLLACHAIGVVEHLARGGDGMPLGALVLACGIALRLWAIATLGASFKTALAPERVVRVGPYRWLAHPSEVGLFVAAAGGALAMASPLAVLVAIAMVPAMVVRCRREDAAIAHALR